MKAIWKYFVDFHKEVDQPLGLYAWITAFVAALTFLNYGLGLEKWMDRLKPAGLPYLAHFILFSFTYFIIVFLCYRYKAIPNVFKSRSFMLKSLFMLLLLTVDVCFHFHRELVRDVFEAKNRYYMHKITGQINSIFVMLLPLLIYYLKFEKTNNNFYGLKTSVRNISQYFPLILLMVPLIFAASFESSFQNYYPRFKEAAQFMGWPLGLRATVFEFFYAADFLFTELFFRGLMVLGFTAFLGPRAILPMVGVYVALHYGKPVGETIGSFFGGYILGVLAYQSKNIWGGIIAHMGVALLMELAAWWQKSIN